MSYSYLKYLTIYCTSGAGLVSHLLLLICLAKDPLKCFRNSASYLVTNLALVDFILCTTGLMRMTFASKIKTVMHIYTTASLVSLFSIFSIAIDRYMLTVHPFTHRAFLNGRRIAVWITSIWLQGFFNLAIDFTFGQNSVKTKVFNSIFITVALLTGLIYLITFVTLKKQEKNMSQRNQCQSRSIQREFLKTIIMVALIQIFTIVPPSVGSLKNLYSRVGVVTVWHVIFLQMYCLNFAINPFLYIWRLKNYRRTFYLLFCSKAR